MGPVDVNGGVHTAHKQHPKEKHSNLHVRHVPCGLGLGSAARGPVAVSGSRLGSPLIGEGGGQSAVFREGT